MFDVRRYGDETGARRGRRAALGVVVAFIVCAALVVVLARRTLAPRAEPAPSAASLWDTDPLVRAAACRIAEAPDLVARAGDADWRVRAAAYTALDGLGPLTNVPMRDVPMAERERILLQWIDAHEPSLRARLCDVFARSEFVEFSDTLVQTCLPCHVGSEPEPTLHADRCAECHESIHEQWSRTAHARSLSHLRLRTVDPVTRAPRVYNFGDRTGLSCTACHRSAGDHVTCAAAFETVSCASCHGDAQAEWEAWGAGPQPRRAVWPPGAIEETHGDDRRCVDCHMPGGEHRWAARRDPELLASGVALSIAEAPGGGAQIVLTNLAGHGFPTGGTRRAIELRASVDDGEERLVATLAPERIGGSSLPSQPALAPGETRVLKLDGAPRSVSCRLVYRRDRFDPESYRIEIASRQRVFPERR